LLKRFTSTFVTGFMVYAHNVRGHNDAPIKVNLRPVAGASMRQDYCQSPSTSQLAEAPSEREASDGGHEVAASPCEHRSSITFTPGSKQSDLNSPFGSFIYSPPSTSEGRLCDSLQDSEVFNSVYQPLCGPRSKLHYNQTKALCSQHPDGNGPHFCIPAPMTGDHFVDYFMPTNPSNIDKFWSSTATAAVPSLYTDWVLEFMDNIDMSHLTVDDLYIALMVQATQSNEFSSPQCNLPTN